MKAYYTIESAMTKFEELCNVSKQAMMEGNAYRGF